MEIGGGKVSALGVLWLHNNSRLIPSMNRAPLGGSFPTLSYYFQILIAIEVHSELRQMPLDFLDDVSDEENDGLWKTRQQYSVQIAAYMWPL